MNAGNVSKLVFLLFSSSVFADGLYAQNSGSPDLEDRLILDTRLRYESVDQEWGGDADALTLRARIGYESIDYDGFRFLIEGEFSQPMDAGDFDAYPGSAGTPGKAVIADGETAELNRAQIKYSSSDLGINVGRQRIILDNARFVGNVGWRQNEQTYDAALFSYEPNEATTLVYSYVDRAQRIFGSEAVAGAQRSFDMETHILNFNYMPDEDDQYGAYYYNVGIDNAAAASRTTFGGFYQGNTELDGGWKLTGRFEFAKQTDNSSSPVGTDFSLDYLHASLAAKVDAFTIGAAWETLDGDGANGFSTPLATLHAFNGWADAFLSTPANGLVDTYGWVAYKFDKTVSAKLVYHIFDAERGSVSYATEIDAIAVWKIDAGTKLIAKYARYNGKGGAPGNLKIDRNKFWLQAEYGY